MGARVSGGKVLGVGFTGIGYAGVVGGGYSTVQYCTVQYKALGEESTSAEGTHLTGMFSLKFNINFPNNFENPYTVLKLASFNSLVRHKLTSQNIKKNRMHSSRMCIAHPLVARMSQHALHTTSRRVKLRNDMNINEPCLSIVNPKLLIYQFPS